MGPCEGRASQLNGLPKKEIKLNQYAGRIQAATLTTGAVNALSELESQLLRVVRRA